MRMKNEKVIENFVSRNNSRNIESHTQNLYTNNDGTKLINYRTTLAKFDFDTMTLYVNTTKYSVTTSKIQNYLKRELQYLHNFKIEYVEHKALNN